MNKMRLDEMRSALAAGERLSDLPLRVTYYARVSTESDAQHGSLINQQSYFEKKIRQNPLWEYVPGYVEEQSGTSAQRRAAFMAMIQDARLGKFDLILTKEVSRFARDLLDSIRYTRELLRHDVGVFFEDIGLNTIEPDAEFRLAIMASVAQEESRKLSERVKFGWRRGQEAGKRHGAAPPIGYKFNNANNGYAIDPASAPVVRYVFARYCENAVGFRTIAEELTEKGYLNKAGKPYHPSTLRRMITNPVYKGYLVGRKTENISYRSKRKRYLPTEEWILHYDPERVPPIVEESAWALANEILEKRSRAVSGIDCAPFTKEGYGKYAYSGRICCKVHGHNYKRATQRWSVKGVRKEREYWVCSCFRKTPGGRRCDAPILYKSDLNQMMREMFLAFVPWDDSALLPALEEAAAGGERMNAAAQVEERIREIKSKKSRLLSGWLDGIVQDEDYRERDKALSSQLSELEKKLAGIREFLQGAQQAEALRRVKEKLSLENERVLEEMVRCFVKKIIVDWDEIKSAYTLKVLLNLEGVEPFCFLLC